MTVRRHGVSPGLAAASIDVAWRLSAYSSYGGKHSRALAALRRRASESTTDECESALVAALDLVDACKAILAEHAAPYLGRHDRYDFSPLHGFLARQLVAFTEKEVNAMLGMVLFYYHLK